jgi:hypothetical protein
VGRIALRAAACSTSQWGEVGANGLPAGGAAFLRSPHETSLRVEIVEQEGEGRGGCWAAGEVCLSTVGVRFRCLDAVRARPRDLPPASPSGTIFRPERPACSRSAGLPRVVVVVDVPSGLSEPIGHGSAGVAKIAPHGFYRAADLRRDLLGGVAIHGQR